MAASDAVGIRAFNQSVDRGRRRESEDRAEGRQQTLDERQDILFNRSTSLFQQQQKFLKDEIAQKKLSKSLNRSVAMFNASGGQVYQPVLNDYAKLPDGGKFLNFRRNDDATFDYEIEWQGKRFKKKGATFDEVGKFMMSIANPVLYLEQSGAMAAAQLEHENAKEIQRIKNLKGKDPLRLMEGTNLTFEEFQDARKNIKEEYDFLREARLDDPADTSLNNEEYDEETKSFGIMTLSEYRDREFAKIGINVAGAVIVDKGVLEQRPIINAASTVAEILFHFDSDVFGAANATEAFEFAIEFLIDNDRLDDADNVIKTSGLQNVPKVQKKLKEAVATARAVAAAKSGADADATAADVEAAKVLVDGGEDTAQTKTDVPIDPVAAFAANNKPATLADAAKDIRAVLSAISKHGKVLRNQQERTKAVKLWKEIASGNPRRGTEAFKMLTAAQTPEGLAKLTEVYSQIRELLDPAIQARLDPSFAGQTKTRFADNPIPDQGGGGAQGSAK